MKKFFCFSGTISGTTFLLRILFVFLLMLPFLVAIIAKWTTYFMSLGNFDISDQSMENQMEIQSFGDELAHHLLKQP